MIGLLLVALSPIANAQKHQLSEMSLERWSKLREVERHQMKIAEKYYREKNYKVASDEYDKYLELYESSDAASYAMMRWSLCQVQLRKQNTAINDGFRSVIDYWPDSDDAIASAYYIGKTFKDIGQTAKAKPALNGLVEKHPKHVAGVYGMVALAEIATIEKDEEAKVKIWRSLTFDALRNRETARHCITASTQLAAHQFEVGEFDEAVEALKTSYNETKINQQVVDRGNGAIRQLQSKSETENKAKQLSSRLIAYLRDQEPEDVGSDESKSKAISLLYLIASVQRTSKDDQGVVKTFGEIQKRFGADDTLLGKIADWHRSREEFEKARIQYRKFKDQVNGLSNIASTFRDEKDLPSAVATYQKLAGEDAENAAKWTAESAAAYREFQKYPEAIQVYQGLLKDDAQNNDRWLWEIASCYNESGKWKEAIGFYRQTDRFPQNYQEMARCHRRLKQQGEAIALYNQIAGGSKPHAPWAYCQIGYTQEEAKSKDKAISAFKKVCKLFPKDRYASVAHAHLQNKYKISVTLGGAKDE